MTILGSVILARRRASILASILLLRGERPAGHPYRSGRLVCEAVPSQIERVLHSASWQNKGVKGSDKYLYIANKQLKGLGTALVCSAVKSALAFFAPLPSLTRSRLFFPHQLAKTITSDHLPLLCFHQPHLVPRSFLTSLEDS